MASKPRKARKLTPEALEALLQYVRNGNYVCAAAKAIGVSKAAVTIHRRKHPDFDTLLRQAEAEAEVTALRGVMSSGERDPKYFQWFLSRKFPERWGDGRHEISAMKKELTELRKMLEVMTIGQPEGHATEAEPPSGGDAAPTQPPYVGPEGPDPVCGEQGHPSDR